MPAKFSHLMEAPTPPAKGLVPALTTSFLYNKHNPLHTRSLSTFHISYKFSLFFFCATILLFTIATQTMVVSLGPGKFYGTSLPRPRIYDDVKFNDHRVDPPLPVSDPLMSWAQEAHWSMGGLSFSRLRLQGKIEGNVNKLRSQREKSAKSQTRIPARSDTEGPKSSVSASLSPLPPPAPIAVKRRRLMAVIEEEENEAEEVEAENEEEIRLVNRSVRRRLVKKLDEDFDRVASENEDSNVSDPIVPRARSRRLVKVGDAMRKVAEEVKKSNLKGKNSESEKQKSPVSGIRVRSSPRLAKKGSN